MGTIVWATGYRRSYSWLQVPEVLGRDGEIEHHGGVTAAAGLYVLGLQFSDAGTPASSMELDAMQRRSRCRSRTIWSAGGLSRAVEARDRIP